MTDRLLNQRVETKEFGLSYHDVFNPVADSAGFFRKGEIKLHNQMVPIEKEPHGVWHEVGLPTQRVRHSDWCLCDECSDEYYAMTGEV